MKKSKVPAIIITSRESLESTVADIVRTKLQAAQLTAAMETEIAQVQKRHQAQILDLDRQIAAKEAGVFVFCQSNRKTLFSEKKSMDLLLATIGFEFNPPSVDKRFKKDTWGDIAKRLDAVDWGQPYITEPEPEVSKAKILADRAVLTPEQLDSVGIAITQEEQFYIRPKSELAEPTTAQAA